MRLKIIDLYMLPGRQRRSSRGVMTSVGHSFPRIALVHLHSQGREGRDVEVVPHLKQLWYEGYLSSSAFFPFHCPNRQTWRRRRLHFYVDVFLSLQLSITYTLVSRKELVRLCPAPPQRVPHGITRTLSKRELALMNRKKSSNNQHVLMKIPKV